VAIQQQSATAFWRPAAHFGFEFIQMCFAMCAGGAILNLAVFYLIGLTGYPNLVQTRPEVSMLILGIDWALAMAVWMAFRGHPWRHNIEMSSTAVIATGLFALASWAGYIHVDTSLGWFSLFTLMCAPACLLMGADMLYRHKHYTSQPGVHARAH
jgi:hypothetical protein